MHDTSRRFVVSFNGWPVASADTLREAEALMDAMRKQQMVSLEELHPFRRFRTNKLWRVTDMGAKTDVKTGT